MAGFQTTVTVLLTVSVSMEVSLLAQRPRHEMGFEC